MDRNFLIANIMFLFDSDKKENLFCKGNENNLRILPKIYFIIDNSSKIFFCKNPTPGQKNILKVSLPNFQALSQTNYYIN